MSEDEAAAMATNGLPIDAGTHLTDPEFERVGNELEDRGIHCRLHRVRGIETVRRSLPLLHQPLLRAD